MTLADRFDARALADLRAGGGMKWVDPAVPIGAFVAEMDFGVAPEITRALHDAVDGDRFGYLTQPLADDLREATATWMRDRYGWGVEPRRVFPVADVVTVLEVAIERTRPGSKVIVPTPAYMPFLFVPTRLGREVIEVPMRDDGAVPRLDLEGIQRAFDAGGELLVVCNPHNPLGRVHTREELLAVCEVVHRNGGRVFADEIWSPLVFDGEHVPYASVSTIAAEHAITGVSASKAFNIPGLKCAQLVASSAADHAWLDEHGAWIGHGASTLGVIANTVAYRQGQPWLDEVVDYLRGSRSELLELVAEHLPGVGAAAPEGTYVGWLDFRRTGIDSPAAFFRERAGVGLTDGVACGAAGAGFARFVFAMPRPIMRQAFERMGEALRSTR